MITDINSEDRLVQETFANYLCDRLGWESVYAYNNETFGPGGTLGRASVREMVLVRDLRSALRRLNPSLPTEAIEKAVLTLTRFDYSRSMLQHNRHIYESRGKKLGIARLDLNERIAAKIEEAELDPDQVSLLERLLGKDYEVITADDRLDKPAEDFVEQCSVCWESGKSMVVCIDKITCARMHKRIMLRWRARIDQLKAELPEREAALAIAGDDEKEKRQKEFDKLKGRIAWMESSQIAIIISEAQNEVKDFAKWDFDIVPHRSLIKQGFETPDGKRIDVETAFKDPGHPFRIAIVCAMWMTGFDVEYLSTMYMDKP